MNKVPLRFSAFSSIDLLVLSFVVVLPDIKQRPSGMLFYI